MPQADFAYAPANDACGLPLGVSIFADREQLRDQLREDVATAGLALSDCGEVAALLEGEPQNPPKPLGEVVLLDCPAVDAGLLAALARLDMRAARSGAHLVVSTTVEALDDVFACCDQSNPQILIDPTRAERVIALGRVLAKVPNLRLRELAEDERLTLLRLTEQVGQIAQRLEKLSGAEPGVLGDDKMFRLESPGRAFNAAPASGVNDGLVRAQRPPLPDPRLIRRIVRQRQLRARFLDGELFADPAWDMLLDLTAARGAHAGLGHFAVHRQRGAADHGAQVDRADDRRRPAPTRRGRSRPPPRLHRPQRYGGRCDGALLRGTGPQRCAAGVTLSPQWPIR